MNDQLERDIRNLFCNTGKFISRDEVTDILVGLIERIQHLEQLRPEQEPETQSRRRFEFEFSRLNVTDDALMEEVRRRGFVIRDAQVGHKWVGLTDGEIKRIGKLDLDSNYFGLWYDFAKAIEAKLKEKNA